MKNHHHSHAIQACLLLSFLKWSRRKAEKANLGTGKTKFLNFAES
jgi:hypothetical protein